MQFYGTRQVAKILNVRPHTLTAAIWNGRVDPPQKSPGGKFLWTPEDIERASWALLHRSYLHSKERDHAN